MRILFINHAFPGLFGPLLHTFEEQGEHELCFASSYSRHRGGTSGVRHVHLGCSDARARCAEQEMQNLLSAGESARTSLEALRGEGFSPDMVVASTVGGYAYHWQECFPEAFRVSWSEDRCPGATAEISEQGMIRRLLQLRQALTSSLFVTLTAGCPSFIGRRLLNNTDLNHAVDTERFSPRRVERLVLEDVNLAAFEELVLFIVRKDSLEDPHLTSSMLTLIERRSRTHVVALCDGSTAMTTLRSFRRGLRPHLSERFTVLGAVCQDSYRDLLCLADMVVVPGSLPSSAILDAMACRVAMVFFGTDPLSTYLRDGDNVICCPVDQGDRLVELLDNRRLLDSVAERARNTVVTHFSGNMLLAQQAQYLVSAYTRWRDRGGNAA